MVLWIQHLALSQLRICRSAPSPQNLTNLKSIFRFLFFELLWKSHRKLRWWRHKNYHNWKKKLEKSEIQFFFLFSRFRICFKILTTFGKKNYFILMLHVFKSLKTGCLWYGVDTILVPTRFPKSQKYSQTLDAFWPGVEPPPNFLF